jgi:hypothetical protein
VAHGGVFGVNKLFLIRARIRVHHYPDRQSDFEEYRIVLAPDEEKARLRYEDHWESKNSEYCVSYYVDILDCEEALEYK